MLVVVRAASQHGAGQHLQRPPTLVCASTHGVTMLLLLLSCHTYCPQVILIHLSNLTGLGHYNKRTMRLLVSDIGTSECAGWCRQQNDTHHWSTLAICLHVFCGSLSALVALTVGTD